MKPSLMPCLSPREPRSPHEPTHYHYIDALRGLAILGVFLIHSSFHVPGLPPRFASLCSCGQYGVQLFFVLSALTLLLSFYSRLQNKQAGLRDFYIRRFFRVAPLFWAGVLLYNSHGLKPNNFAPDGLGWGQIVASLAFVNGWYPTYINSAIPGGWSIAVETTFYAVFPFLAARLSNPKRTLLALLAAVAAANFANHFLFYHMAAAWQGRRAHLLEVFLGWWLPSQMPVFLIGFLLYSKIEGLAQPKPRALEASRRTALACIAAAWLIIAVLVQGFPLQGLLLMKLRSTSLLATGFGAAFALLTYGLALVPFRLFVNRFTRHLGVVSFSGYIDHFFVLDKLGLLDNACVRHWRLVPSPLMHYALFCGVSLPLTVALATLTYHAIEKPGMALGQKLIARLSKARAPFPARTGVVR